MKKDYFTICLDKLIKAVKVEKVEKKRSTGVS